MAGVFIFNKRSGSERFRNLPFNAVDIESRSIKQCPFLCVNIKFKKHATTYLLQIPELLEVVTDWDGLVRESLPENGYWFAPLFPLAGTIDTTINNIVTHRAQQVRKDLKRWLDLVDLPYKNLHAFRHGHATYAIQNAQDVTQLKAVSQNLMHGSISTTDSIYAILSERDVHQQINTLSKPTSRIQRDVLHNMQTRLDRLEKCLK